MTCSVENGKSIMVRWVSNVPSLRVVILGLAVSALASGAFAGGDAAAGKEKAATCAACHGADGVSQIPTNPILAGQYASYLEQALKEYRSGVRQNAIMAGFATQLSDQDIEDLAAWFASQKGPLKTTR